MGLRLRPVDTSFYDLFTASAQHLVDGVALLAEMLNASADHADVARRMREAEHRADETTHALVKLANASFVTPLDREDIYELGTALDDVMDLMDAAVDLILLYEITVVPPELSEQVEVLQRCADLTAASMPGLASPAALAEYWIEINRLENTGDRNHRRALAKLLSGELKTVEVLKLKDLAETLERAIDAFENIANRVEQIALKES